MMPSDDKDKILLVNLPRKRRAIFVIYIIASLIMIPPRINWGHGRDGKRISDLKQIQNGLELFFAVCKKYPATLSGLSDPSSAINCVGAPTGVGMIQLPLDPTTGQPYYYETMLNGMGYKVCAKMEDVSNYSDQYCKTSSPPAANQ